MIYKDACYRCNGTGIFQWFSMGQVAEGNCFRCRGRGFKAYKTSPEARAKARAKAQAKRDAKLAASNAEREARAIEAANRRNHTLYLYSLTLNRIDTFLIKSFSQLPKLLRKVIKPLVLTLD